MQKDGWKTSEFWVTIVILVGVFWKAPEHALWAIGLAALYVIGRSMTKTNIVSNRTYHK